MIEGTGTTTPVLVPILLTPPLSAPATLSFETLPGTALEDDDYLASSGTLQIPAGVSEISLPIQIRGDHRAEANESFTIRFHTTTPGISIPEPQITLRIIEDDPPPELWIEGGLVAEGDSDSPRPGFTARLSHVSDSPVRFTYRAVGVNATPRLDFLPMSGTLEFPPGVLSLALPIVLIDDEVAESRESIELEVVSIENALRGARRSGLTIVDDDVVPVIQVSSAEMVEGDDPTSPRHLVFDVTLSAPPKEPVAVSFETVPGSAEAHRDYLPVSGRITFVVFTGEWVTHQIRVPILGDAEPEGNETFGVRFSQPAHAILATDIARGLIVNDDGPTLRIGDVTTREPDSGTGPAQLRVALTLPSRDWISVDYFTSEGTATAGRDFHPVQGTLHFPPGQTERTLEVPIIADDAWEPPEQFLVHLTSPSRATLSHPSATVTIQERHALAWSANSTAVTEGNERPSLANLVVSLPNPVPIPTRINFRTLDDTARAGLDYVAAFGTVGISANTLQAIVPLIISADDLSEGTEFFRVALSDADRPDLAEAEVLVTILDDDPLPTVHLADVVFQECATNSTVEIQLSAASGMEVRVDVVAVPGTARAAEDYILEPTTLLFPPGTLRVPLTLGLRCDARDEPEETFEIELRNPRGATVPSRPARITLLDQDPPEVRVDAVRWPEGPGVTSELPLAIRLTSPATEPVRVTFATRSGSALSGLDYLHTSGSVEFAPGVLQRNIPLTILPDSLVEGPETFVVQLATDAPVRVIDEEVTVTITDYNLPTLLLPENSTFLEPASAARSVEFLFRLSEPSPLPVSVEVSTHPRSAFSRIDFLDTNGVVTFPPGSTQAMFHVTLIGDDTPEPDEQFLLTLQHPIHAQLIRSNLFTTLVDDDLPPPPHLTVSADPTPEGNSGYTSFPLILTLSSPPWVPASVTLTTEAGTANPGRDFIQRSQTIVFAPGQISATAFVSVVGDSTPEPDETILVRLSQPSQLVPLVDSLLLWVRDDDGYQPKPPQLTWRSPETEATFEQGEAIPLEWEVGDEDSPLPRLSILLDDQPIGTLPVPPWSFLWRPTASGTFQIEAVATDSSGLETSSGPRTFHVTAHPKVRWESPAVAESNALAWVTLKLSEPSRLPLSVELQTHPLSAMEGQDFGAIHVVTNLPAGLSEVRFEIPILQDDLHEEVEEIGIQVLTRFASDPEASITQLTLAIHDDDPPLSTTPPALMWLEPQDRALSPLGAPITLRGVLAALAPTPTLARVEFLADDLLLGTATQPPFDWVWNSPPPGVHRLRMKSYTADGASSTSAVVRISIAESCGQVGVVLRPTISADTESILDALFDLNLSASLLPSVESSPDLPMSIRALIWIADDSTPTQSHDVAWLISQHRHGKAVLWLGPGPDPTRDGSSPETLAAFSAWTGLAPDVPRPGELMVRKTATAHASEAGRALTRSLAEFTAPLVPAVRAKDDSGRVQVLMEADGVPIVAVQDPGAASGRFVYLGLGAAPTHATYAGSSVRRLIQNAAWWLMSCPPCRDFQLVPSGFVAPATASRGDHVIWSLNLETPASCAPIATRLSVSLPDGLEFVAASFGQGKLSRDDRRVHIDFGPLPPRSDHLVWMETRTVLPGRHRPVFTWDSLSQSGELADEAAFALTLDVFGPAVLFWHRLNRSELQLVIHGTPGAMAHLESATDLTSSWLPWQSVFVGAEPALLPVSIPLNQSNFFVRPVP